MDLGRGHACSSCGHSSVLAFDDREYSLAELDALTSGMATELEHRGVTAG